jgi:hypothetical protein
MSTIEELITPQAKSTDYLVRFLGHVIEIKRPDGFPQVVWFDKIFRVPNRVTLEGEINKEATTIIMRQRGMVVTKNQNPGHVQTGDDVSFENRIFVPMEMLAYVECEVTDITGETPNFEDGVAFVGQGLEKKELKAN